jgi:hypothetical protein
MSVAVARLSGFSYTAQMDLPLLSPGAVDALLFDIGRVVLDIDFNKTVACWAGHAGCEPTSLVGRITSRDEIYQRHEKGQISDAEFFGAVRALLGIGISDAQFLEGWNAIFAGEMPGIAPLLERAAKRLPLYAFYDHVVKAIGAPAERIVFFDDLAENIDGARAHGLRTVHVRSVADVAEALAALGI